jgi:hypothetical protein
MRRAAARRRTADTLGEPDVIRERLGQAVTDIVFDRERMLVPALSASHYRTMFERTAGPVIKLIETMKDQDPKQLAAFRRDYEALVADYFRDNVVRHDYLLTRATKV